MAYVKVDKTQLRETLYSRYRSPDRRLYTWAEVRPTVFDLPEGVAPKHWWVYNPIPSLMPVRPLSAQDRAQLEEVLPF